MSALCIDIRKVWKIYKLCITQTIGNNINIYFIKCNLKIFLAKALYRNIIAMLVWYGELVKYFIFKYIYINVFVKKTTCNIKCKYTVTCINLQVNKYILCTY